MEKLLPASRFLNPQAGGRGRGGRGGGRGGRGYFCYYIIVFISYFFIN